MAEKDNNYDSRYESEDNSRDTKADEIITLLRQDLIGIRGFITKEFIKLAQHNQGIIDVNNPEFQQAHLSLLESDPNAPENRDKAVLSLKATLQGINKKLERAQNKQNIDPRYFKKFKEEMNSTAQEIRNQLSTETELKSLINRRLVGKLFNKVMIMDLDKDNNPVLVHPSKKQALLEKILPSIRDLPPDIEKKMLLGSVPQELEEKINREVLKHFTQIDKSQKWGVLDQGRLTNENIKNFSGIINQAIIDSSVKKEIIKLFNEKPKTGIEKIKTWCTQYNKDYEEETAKIFYEEKNNLNLKFVGDYLGTDGQDNKKVLENFAKRFNFKEKNYLESLREFLGSFKLPGEAQKIDRLVENFGSQYYDQNLSGEIKGKDASYILAFQIIMLNTDLHNPSITKSKKMTFEQLQNNLRGTNENQNFSDEFLKSIYDGIKENPFKLNLTTIATGYEIADVNSKNDKTFKKLNDFLTTKTDINNIFPDLQNNITAECKQPKTWLNKFTGYEGSVLITAGNTEVEIQVYKPNILSQWFLGEKNKLVIQSKQQSEQSLKLAAQIAKSFETKVTSINATYDYLKEDLEANYKKAGKGLEQVRAGDELHSVVRDINTQQGLATLEKTPSRSAFKGSRELAKQEVQQIGADLARKQASPKERAKEDQKVALDIVRKARVTKRSQGR